MSSSPDEFALLPLREKARLLIEAGESRPHPAREFHPERVLYELEVQQAELEIQNEELRRIQGEIEAASEKYQDLYDFAPVGYLSLSEQCRIEDANLAASSLFGVARQSLTGRKFSDFVAASDQETFSLHFARTCQRIGKSEIELRLRTAGATAISARLQISSTDLNGRFFCRIAIIDVTAYRKTESDLRASQSRFRELAEAMPQVVWSTDDKGRLTYFNGNLLSLADAREQSNALEVFSSLVHRDDLPRFAGAWNLSLSKGSPFEGQFRLERPGSSRWHLCRALAVLDSDCKVTRWYGTWTDIHEQKLHEDALREADTKKDEFLAMLAHELRNPLAAIQSALALETLARASEEQRTWGRDIARRQVKHLARLIDDLLDVSRITHGKIQLRKVPTNFRSIIDRSIEVVRPMIAEKNHELVLEIPDLDVMLDADPTRLEQVLVNLLSNAAKYTDPGGRIVLRAEIGEKNICLTVSDNGAGIEPNLLRSVFDLFFQQSSSFDRAKGGLGIGLTLVKRLVEMHGGYVTAHSEGLAQGSTFVVTLPYMPIEVRPVAPSLEKSGRTESLRILLIDDNSDELETLKILLEHLGHVVYTAPDGPSALGIVSDVRPDLAIVDLGLPGMTGFEVAKKFRERADAADCVLFALTGYGQDHHRLESKRAGFSLHFTKPVDFEELTAELDKVTPARQAPLAVCANL